MAVRFPNQVVATNLKPGSSYGLAMSWLDASGAGINEGVNQQVADQSGRLVWDGSFVLGMIARLPGPRTLRIAVTDSNDKELGGKWVISQTIV